MPSAHQSSWRRLSATALAFLLAVSSLAGCWAGSRSEQADSGVDSGPGPDAAAVYYVDLGNSQPGDGRSWETAFTTVQEGIDAAALDVPTHGAVQVWVAAGTYFVFDEDRADTIALAPAVEVYGGFAGHESDLAARDWVANETVLDGRRDDDDGSADRVFHVVTGSEEAVLDGFAIRFGSADGGEWPTYYGGGMYNYASSPTVANCRFEHNRAKHGGGMYNEDGADALVTDCVFRQNTTSGNGGGMRNSESSPEVSGCTFELNEAEEDGGGMANGGGSPTITACAFIENEAGTSDRGGGMHNHDGTEPAIKDSTFFGNRALYGGGMSNAHSSPVVAGCDFVENKGTALGGGAFIEYESPSFTGCSFVGNDSNRGGGVYARFDWGEIEGCAFVENRAMRGAGVGTFRSDIDIASSLLARNEADYYGGGLYCEDGDTTVVSSTFCENAADFGSGVYLDEDARVEVVGCILWDDPVSEVAAVDLSAILTASYSDVRGGWDGAGNIDAEPLFVDLEGGDLRLQSGSPCIDASDGESAPAVDLDGNPRVDDPGAPNTGLGPPWADMGAYELQP